MNRHCIKFTTHNQYEEFIRNNDLLLPNVSICGHEPIIHYNPYSDPTNGYDYVNLGLPSGLRWATCNVRADHPYDYGDYFMWGSTTPDTYNTCDWAHAPFNNGSASYDETYFNSVKDSVCPKGILAPEYDAVRAIMGGNWRMPTENDFTELLNNTTNAWVENYEGSGINGRLFTSRTDDSKTLFIPASGYRSGSSFGDRGSNMTLWSSSINASSPNYARDLYGYASSCSMSNHYRYRGFCLRGVIEFYH